MTFFNAAVAGALLAAIPAAARAQAPDFRTEAAQIVRADTEFARSVAERNKQAFLSFLADATTFNGGTPNEIHGSKTVLDEWSVFFDPDGPTLSWAPIKGEVIGAGDVGYTVGRSLLRGKAADGTMRERQGQYLTVWRKQDDGSWKVVFDTGSNLP